MSRIPAQLWFALLCLAWLMPGLVGHLPWKGPDADVFALYLQTRDSGQWLLPGLTRSAGTDFAPLYFWIAHVFAQFFSFILAPHDAIRLASGVLTASALWLAALTGRRLYGSAAGWPVVFALLGCAGLLIPAHEINPHTAQLAAISLFAYGLARMLREPMTGGALAGSGLAALFLTGAWLPALALALVLAVLPLPLKSWRTSARIGGAWFALSIFIALVGVWLLSAYQADPQRFTAWWREASAGVVFAATGNARYQPTYFVEALTWFAWPAWLVAGWAVYRLKREGWDSVRLWLPLGIFLAGFVALSLQVRPKQIQTIILLLPLALLAGAGLAELRRGAANALMWFAIMSFSVLGLAFWLHGMAFEFGWPEQLASRLNKLGLQSQDPRVLPLLLALAVTAAWVIGLGWVRRQPRVPQRPMLIWSGGVTFVWFLLMSLFMQPLDQRLSLKGVGQAIQTRVGTSCVAAPGMEPALRTLVAYHAEVSMRMREDPACDWKLLFSKARKEPAAQAGWIKVWSGGRPGEKGERFWLYHRA